MELELAHKSQFHFEPAAVADLSATGEQYATPAEWAVNLGPLLQLSYKRAEIKVKAQLSATGTGAATISIKAGAETLKTFEIDNALPTQSFKAALPIGLISPDVDLTATVTVTTTAAATMTMDAAVEVETPLVIGSC